MWGFIHKWHRNIGVIASLFVVILVITGLLLNHTDGLKLQDRFVKNEWLLDWYRIQPKQKLTSFNIDQHWFTQIDSRLYFDQKELANEVNRLSGVVAISDGYVIALDGSLLILTLTGELVEGLSSAEGVPSGIKSIGLTEQGEVVIKAAHGDYLADIDAIEWQEKDGLTVNWSMSSEVPETLKTELLQLFRGKGLSLERVLLDVHSGRIFGKLGVLIVDFMAILFLLLAASGVWMWTKYR